MARTLAPNPQAEAGAPAARRWALLLWSSAIFGLQIGVARLGYGLALPAIRRALHGNYAAYGAVNTASLAGYLFGALAAPLLLRFVPRLVLWSSFVAGAALVASAFANDVVSFGIARTVFGLASGVSLVAAAVETLEAVEGRIRGSASAAMWAGIGVGLALSALATAWLLAGASPWRLGSLLSGLATLVAGIGYQLVLRRGERSDMRTPAQPRVPEIARFDLRDLVRPHRFLFLCLAYGAFGFAYISYATFVVASLEARLGPAQAAGSIALLWGLYGLASVAGSFAIARVLDGRFGGASMALTGLAGTIGCAIAVSSPHAAALGAIFVGFGLAATPAAATAFARARSTSDGAPAAIAAVTVAVGIGQLVGPLASGIAADAYGPASVALLAGCVYLLGMGFAVADAVLVRDRA